MERLEETNLHPGDGLCGVSTVFVACRRGSHGTYPKAPLPRGLRLLPPLVRPSTLVLDKVMSLFIRKVFCSVLRML